MTQSRLTLKTTNHASNMTSGKIEAYQADLLVSDIIEVGGWPVIEGPKWNERSFDWITTILKFRKMGFNHNIFLALFVGPDVRNSTRHVAQVCNC